MKKLVLTAFAATVLLAFIVVPLTCYAQTEDEGSIYGCYKKVNGQLRLVDSPEKCRPSEEPISWSQESGGTDLSSTSVLSCQDVTDCLCSDGGFILNGSAECPAGAVLASVGTSADGKGFHAECIFLSDQAGVNPVDISIRCLSTVSAAEINCSDGIDNDGEGSIDCDDADCADDPACSQTAVVVPAEICSDEIDNDGDGLVDCADTDCLKNRACKKKKK